MTPERWARMSEVFAAALDRPAAERSSFLDNACGSDESLRREVERLLAEPQDSWLRSPVEFAPPPELGAGQVLGRYRVEAKLGQGGMGAVYRAHDTVLRRPVALKVLPPGRLADSEDKRRLTREARAASALNHPNIVTIHDIGSEDGTDFIAMELIEGQPLDRMIPGKGLPLSEALGLAVQIAQGMVAAHGAGIVHRDLKPANVMVTRSGLVKLLDFGLARRVEVTPGEGSTATAQGVIAGTVAYMSPEQAEGKPVDVRSDIFSFGSLLYEMVSGQRAFRGETQASTLAAVIKGEPRPLDEKVPNDLRRVILRCLRKDAARRFQSMADVGVALREVKEETESGQPAPVTPRHSWRRRWWVWAGSTALFVVLAVTVWKWGPLREEGSFSAVPILTPREGIDHPAISPDGNSVVYMWPGERKDNIDIYAKLIGPGTPIRLTSDPAIDYSPAWSPDGRWIAFLRAPKGYLQEPHELIRVPAQGGPELKIGDFNVHAHPVHHLGPYLAWTPDSRSLVLPQGDSPSEPASLVVVPVDTGVKRRLTTPTKGSSGDSGPAFSPDGRKLAFGTCFAFSRGGNYIVSLDRNYALAGEPVRVGRAGLESLFLAWAPDGRDLVISVSDRIGYRLHRIRAEPGHEPRALRGVGEDGVFPSVSPAAHRLLYCKRREDQNIWQIDLDKPGGTGVRRKLLAGSTRLDDYPIFSADGSKFAYLSSAIGIPQIVVCERDGTDCLQVTSIDKGYVVKYSWSPDGREFAFQWLFDGKTDIYAVPATGGRPKRLTTHPGQNIFPGWSRDSKWIYFASNRTGSFQIWKMSREGESAGEPIQITQGGGMEAQESWDGKTVYYSKDLVGSLWSVPPNGGKEVEVVDRVISPCVAPVENGIYVIRPIQHLMMNGALEFLRYSTGKLETVFDIGLNVGAGLSVSPDRRTVLYTQVDSQPSDLMLVENFR